MNNKSMGEFIAELRKEKGLTQRELAEYLNVSDKTVSHWECGKNSPDISVLPILAEYFDITCDELIKGERKAITENFEKDAFTPSYSFSVTENSKIYLKKKNEKTMSKAHSKHKILCVSAVFVSFFSLMLLLGIIVFAEYMTGFDFIREAVCVAVAFAIALCLLITFISKQNFMNTLKSCTEEISETKKWKIRANLVCIFPLIYSAAVLFVIVSMIMPSGTAGISQHETMTIPASVTPNMIESLPDDSDISVPVSEDATITDGFSSDIHISEENSDYE